MIVRIRQVYKYVEVVGCPPELQPTKESLRRLDNELDVHLRKNNNIRKRSMALAAGTIF